MVKELNWHWFIFHIFLISQDKNRRNEWQNKNPHTIDAKAAKRFANRKLLLLCQTHVVIVYIFSDLSHAYERERSLRSLLASGILLTCPRPGAGLPRWTGDRELATNILCQLSSSPYLQSVSVSTLSLSFQVRSNPFNMSVLSLSSVKELNWLPHWCLRKARGRRERPRWGIQVAILHTIPGFKAAAVDFRVFQVLFIWIYLNMLWYAMYIYACYAKSTYSNFIVDICGYDVIFERNMFKFSIFFSRNRLAKWIVLGIVCQHSSSKINQVSNPQMAFQGASAAIMCRVWLGCLARLTRLNRKHDPNGYLNIIQHIPTSSMSWGSWGLWFGMIQCCCECWVMSTVTHCFLGLL